RVEVEAVPLLGRDRDHGRARHLDRDVVGRVARIGNEDLVAPAKNRLHEQEQPLLAAGRDHDPRGGVDGDAVLPTQLLRDRPPALRRASRAPPPSRRGSTLSLFHAPPPPRRPRAEALTGARGGGRLGRPPPGDGPSPGSSPPRPGGSPGSAPPPRISPPSFAPR